MELNIEHLRQTFLEEAAESVETMESGLIRLGEGDQDPELIHTIFRAAHSMKGGAGSVGFPAITEFTHSVETLLDQMRSGSRGVETHVVDLLLGSVDSLRGMLHSARETGAIDATPYQSTRKTLEDLLAAPASLPLSATKPPESTGFDISFRPRPSLLRSCNDPLRIIEDLRSLGALDSSVSLRRLPAFRDLDPETCYFDWDFKLSGTTDKSRVMDVFAWVDGDCDLDVKPILLVESPSIPEVSSPAPSSPATQDTSENSTRTESGKGAASTTTSSIRVEIDKIDALINMVGELVITQSMLGQLGEEFDMNRLDRLKDGLVQLQRHTRELQESVMRIRMLPIGFAFNRFPRLVRDLGRQLGKQVDLKVSGEQTELDKTVLEKISDPLVHLVRNALDHGIETPDIRSAAGKPETGILSLNAFHHSGNIVIEIKDDGRGIDKDRVLAKARKAGIVAIDETPTDDKIIDLIFQPGFSTAEVISDVSGRGVGMDVVRRNILALGGNISTTTELNRGTTFTIRLPLTLAILDGQTVRVGHQRYIVPLVQIVEAIQIKPDQVRTVSGRAEMFKLRDQFIPIIRLYQVLDIEPENREITQGLVVVVECDGRRFGMFVDELLGQQQIVIKSLETNLARIEGLSGATILGDGQVALILDIPGLVAVSKRRPVELLDESSIAVRASQ